MAPINQISRLIKIPLLLNRKREAEEESKKNKREKDSPPFPPDDKSFLKKSQLKKVETPQKKETNPKTADDNIGSNLDLTV